MFLSVLFIFSLDFKVFYGSYCLTCLVLDIDRVLFSCQLHPFLPADVGVSPLGRLSGLHALTVAVQMLVLRETDNLSEAGEEGGGGGGDGCLLLPRHHRPQLPVPQAPGHELRFRHVSVLSLTAHHRTAALLT